MDPLFPQGAPPLEAWHPKVRRLFEYWRSHRPEPDLLPGRQHFEPLDVVELLPHIWMLEDDEATGRTRYRLVGTRIVEAMRRDVTGQWHDQAHPGSAKHPRFIAAREKLKAGLATWRRGPPWFQVDPEIYEVEVAFFPMARDGRNVDLTIAISIFFYRNGAEAFT